MDKGFCAVCGVLDCDDLDCYKYLTRNDEKVVVKVYHHIWSTGRAIEQTMIFFTKEFGYMEYFDKADMLHFETKKDLIVSTYRNKSIFKKYGMLQYLGEL